MGPLAPCTARAGSARLGVRAQSDATAVASGSRLDVTRHCRGAVGLILPRLPSGATTSFPTRLGATIPDPIRMRFEQEIDGGDIPAEVDAGDGTHPWLMTATEVLGAARFGHSTH